MFLTGSVHGICICWRDGLLSGRQQERQGGFDPANSLAGSAWFFSAQVLLLDEQRGKFEPPALKRKEGARPGQNPTTAAGRHLHTPKPEHPPTAAQHGSIPRPRTVTETPGSHRASSAPTSALGTCSANFPLSAPQLWPVFHAVALQSHRKLPGG